ncbi:MAG: hypothetical protein V1874_03640 [Spirochaetota bacterium]
MKEVNFKYVITGDSSSVSVTFLTNSGEVHGGNSAGSTWVSSEINSLPWNYDFTVKLSDICQQAVLYATNNDIGSSITIAIYTDDKLASEMDIAGGSSGSISDDFCQ